MNECSLTRSRVSGSYMPCIVRDDYTGIFFIKFSYNALDKSILCAIVKRTLNKETSV